MERPFRSKGMLPLPKRLPSPGHCEAEAEFRGDAIYWEVDGFTFGA